MGTARKTEADFWNAINTAPAFGCWEWKKCSGGFGYGQTWWRGRLHATHRLAAYFSGLLSDLESTKCVLHKCDNPLCCRPSHLFIGDRAINARDRDKKGRKNTAKGERAGNAKLSNRKASQLRKDYKSGLGSTRELAKAYGIGKTAVWRIVNMKGYTNG